jgi:hypothetical protein
MHPAALRLLCFGIVPSRPRVISSSSTLAIGSGRRKSRPLRRQRQIARCGASRRARHSTASHSFRRFVLWRPPIALHSVSSGK